jgi:hypothetical protein
MAKVLIAYVTGDHYGTYGFASNSRFGLFARNSLINLGYEVDTKIVEDDSAFYTELITDDKGYDFGVFVRGGGSALSPTHTIGDVFLAGLTKIPVFHINHTTFNGLDNHGLYKEGASALRVCDWAFNSSSFQFANLCTKLALRVCDWAFNSSSFQFANLCTKLLVRTSEGFTAADYDYYATSSDDGAPVAARYKSGTTSVYIDSSGSEGSLLFPLMQAAIDRGEMPPPPRKGLVCYDIDDFPGADSTQADHEAAYAIMEKYGIYASWGIHASEAGLAEQPDSTWTWLESKSIVNGGYIYPMEHLGGTFWNDTKPNIDTFYRSHVTNMQAKGITTGWDADGLDSFYYHYANTNQIGETGLQLMSPNDEVYCSPADDTQQVGYGIRVQRTQDGGTAGGGGQGLIRTSRQQLELAQLYGVYLMAGNNRLLSTDKAITLSGDMSEFYGATVRDALCRSVQYNNIAYMHGGNFWDGHDGGTAPGQEVLTIIGEMVTYCKDILKFAHPSEVAERQGMVGIPLSSVAQLVLVPAFMLLAGV